MDLKGIYQYLNTDISDYRTNDWPLISSPVALALISCAYLYVVLYTAPNYMKNRKPYSLKTFIQGYNVFQIVANALIVYHIIDVNWWADLPTTCFDPEVSFEYNSYKSAVISWYTFCLKLIDFVETLLFVLRKKQNQVSFLHLYHHVSTVWLAWITTKYCPHLVSMTVYAVNCSIHVLMYTYYLLTSFGPKMQRILQPVKPLITISQMVQFVVLLTYLTNFVFCRQLLITIIAYIAMFDLIANFALFYNFYRKNYTSKVKKNK